MHAAGHGAPEGQHSERIQPYKILDSMCLLLAILDIFLVVVRYAVSQAHGAANGNEIAVNHARHVAVRRSETPHQRAESWIVIEPNVGLVEALRKVFLQKLACKVVALVNTVARDAHVARDLMYGARGGE